MAENKEAVAAAFREEIKHAFEPGAKVMTADRELRYCLELQRDRLVKRNLAVTDEMIHGGPFPNGLNNVRNWVDGHYETSWAVDFIDHKKTFQRAGMKTFKYRQQQSIYEAIVDVRDGEDVSEDTYSCPNCGNIATIREFQDGCKSCGTSFKMSDLFPKVSNYFFVWDVSSTATNFKWKIIRNGLYLLPVSCIMMLCMMHFERGVNLLEHFKSVGNIISFIIGLAIMVPAFGFVSLFYEIIFKMIRQMVKDTPLLAATATSRKKFEWQMSRICPEYTFEHFISKMVSMFKIVVFSDRDDELPFYKGRNLGNMLDDIVDVSPRGVMSCRRVWTEGNMVYVTGDIYAEVTRDLGTKLKRRDEVYRITAGRRIDIPFTKNFSITSIQCSSCGGSFNAYKSKKCPYCGTEYEQANSDWIICDIKKK